MHTSTTNILAGEVLLEALRGHVGVGASHIVVREIRTAWRGRSFRVNNAEQRRVGNYAASGAGNPFWVAAGTTVVRGEGRSTLPLRMLVRSSF